MAVAVASSSNDTASASADTLLQPALPSGTVAGDLLLAFGYCLAVRTISPPAGFTQLITDANADNRAYVWYKVAAGSDNLDFTISGTFGTPSVAVLRITGGDSTGIVSGAAHETVNDNTAECPSVTTTAANALVLSMAGAAGGNTSTASPTEEVDITGGSFGTHLGIYSEIQAAAGASPGRTITNSGFSKWVAFTVAINAAASGISLAISPALVNLLAKAPGVSVGGVSVALTHASVNLLAKAPAVTVGGVSLGLSPALVNLLGKVVGLNGVFPGTGLPQRIGYLLRQMKIGRIR